MGGRWWMNPWVLLAAALIGLICLWLGGCATPERTLTSTTWHDNGTTATQTIAHETGGPLYLRERSNMQTGPGIANTADTSGKTAGEVALGVAGAAAGAYAGGPIGMLAGGAGGYALGKLTGDRPTTGSTATAAGALAPLLLKSAGRSGNAAVGAPVGALSDSGLPGGDVNPQVDSLITPEALKVINPVGVELLKGYIRAHPEACRLAGVIGVENVIALIDRLGATP